MASRRLRNALGFLAMISLLMLTGEALAAKPHKPVTLFVPENFASISQALGAALAGDTIVVGPGTYYENIAITPGIAVRSSNPADPLVVAATIIDGGNLDATVTIGGGPDTVLSGFTIRNGAYVSSTLGGGIVVSSSPTISHCIVTENDGVGIAVQFGSPRINDCTISNNIGVFGGLYVRESAAIFTNCEFFGNRSGGDASAITISGGAPSFIDCVIRNNFAPDYYQASIGGSFSTPSFTNCKIIDNSGGAYFYNGSQRFENCLVRGNALFGVSVQHGSAEILNCTIAANGASAVKAQWEAAIFLTNTVLWDNGAQVDASPDSVVTATNCDVQGGLPGSGNFDLDPLFLSAEDSRLSEASPCVDAGIDLSTAGVTSDIDGIARPQGSAFDIGAYERPSAVCSDSDLDGWTTCGGDCDDRDAQVNPSMNESGRRRLDGKDNDCNGIIDG